MSAWAGSTHAGWGAVFVEMLLGVRAAVYRFPAVALFLLAAMLQSNLLISGIDLFHTGRDLLDPELVIGLSAGAIAALSVALFGESCGISALLKAIGGLAAGAIVTALIVFSYTFDTLEWTLLLGLTGAILLAPVVRRGSASAFWMFSARIAFAALLALLALLLFAGGISAILTSLTLLFGLDVPSELYQHVWAFTGLFAAPLFGLGQVPERFDEKPGHEAAGFMDRGMRALGDFVAAPLLITYAVILHVYALKIVVSGDVPEGQIGWLVFIYGVCVYGALLLINPFFDRARAPTRFLLRFWPFFQIVPLGLLAYAVTVRIGSYGVTPDRFFLALFGLVAALIVLIQLVPRLRGDTRWMALLPVLALIFGSFGPQGAVGASIRSQAERFLQIVDSEPLSDEQNDQALSALSALNRYDALSRVAPPNGTLDAADAENFMKVAKAWGLDPTRDAAVASGRAFNRRDELAAFGIGDYDTIVEGVSLSSEGGSTPTSVNLPSGEQIAFAVTQDNLVVTQGRETARFPISPDTFQDLLGQQSNDSPEVELQAGGRKLKILLDHIYFSESEDGEPVQVQALAGAILLHSADWSQQ
ncbi:DUF4153 domain-containing protein [Chelativorans sp. YIM 93263]|uniref:DUF4153 domain-containing protein n=1 Tax=Chelativorans sp. YIM 93263 TaxID=2906648 RepID=UPI0023794606|nr:DUF4153 domain-containing protein [Chelativorans sp. YIM 93263]